MNKVLIIDDSSLSRDFYSRIVKAAGFAYTTAADGMEGLEKAMAEQFQLILTDVNMQGMDGYEFIRRVRRNAEYEAVPIIIISTEASEQDKQQGFSAGASLYLVKPTDANRILESIKLLMGKN